MDTNNEKRGAEIEFLRSLFVVNVVVSALSMLILGLMFLFSKDVINWFAMWNYAGFAYILFTGPAAIIFTFITLFKAIRIRKECSAFLLSASLLLFVIAVGLYVLCFIPSFGLFAA